MQADLIMTIALLKRLQLLTEKEAKNLFEELRFKNLSTELDQCIAIVDEAFKKHAIGVKKESTTLTINGKEVTVTK